MFYKKILLVLGAFGLMCFCQMRSLAQGGWDLWTVSLRDGDSVDAAPLWSLDEKELRHGFTIRNGAVVKRSAIILLSNDLANSAYRMKQGTDYVRPEPPKGDFDKDLVVMADGRRVFGRVIIRPGRHESGRLDRYNPVLFQNGVETALTEVAFIKLATASGNQKKIR